MKHLYVIAAIAMVGASLGPVRADGVPQLVNYQGKVYQPSGAAVPDGAYKVAFSIYDVPTAGTAIWTETYDTLMVKGSSFHVLLGSGAYSLPLNSSIFSGQERYLGVKLGNDPELSPRQKIASVPYAMVAEKVPPGSITSNELADGAVIAPKIGPSAITTDKMANGSVIEAKIAANAITNAAIDDGCVNARTIAIDPLSMSKISGGGMVTDGNSFSIGTSNLFAKLYVSSGDVRLDNGYRLSFGGFGNGTTIWDDSDRTCLTAKNNEFQIVTQSNSAYIASFNPTQTHIWGNLVVSGSKSAVVDTASYGQRLLYAIEAPENRFADEGVDRLANGIARITVDPIFLETIEGSFVIQITPYGDSLIYVAERGKDYFTVKARTGEPDVDFAWRLSACRKGYSGVRLAQPKK